MPTAAERYRQEILRWFPRGGVHVFVGAGGKSTAMRETARLLVSSGAKVRMTTTTRVGIEEFHGVSLRTCTTRQEVLAALAEEEPLLLIVAGKTADGRKYHGLPVDLVECLPLDASTVVLVEADGSRGLPMKAPREHEPVIPADASSVIAVLGAAAFGERVDAEHCYNHESALKILAVRDPAEARFGPGEISVLAASREAYRKGVTPGMAYRVLINQADLPDKRVIAQEAVQQMFERFGLRAALVSFRQGEMYDPAAR